MVYFNPIRRRRSIMKTFLSLVFLSVISRKSFAETHEVVQSDSYDEERDLFIFEHRVLRAGSRFREHHSLRKQCETCTSSADCEPGLKCYKALGASACLPDFTLTCLSKTILDVALDVGKSMVGDLGDFLIDSIRQPRETAQLLGLSASNFTDNLLDVYEKYEECAKQEYLEEIGQLRVAGIPGLPTVPLPRLNLGLTADLGALFGGTGSIGVYLDPSEILPEELEFSTIRNIDLAKLRFGGFVNLCLGLVGGASTKYGFNAGLAFVKQGDDSSTDGTTETDGESKRNFDGFRNYCMTSDIGIGAGFGGYFCGSKESSGFLDFFRDTPDGNYYFELGGSTGLSIGADITANMCKLYTYEL